MNYTENKQIDGLFMLIDFEKLLIRFPGIFYIMFLNILGLVKHLSVGFGFYIMIYMHLFYSHR